MNVVWTLARREWLSLLCTPLAYAVLAVFSLVSGLLFLANFGAGAPASLRGVAEGLIWLGAVLVPALAMRSLSEERHRGTLERLMTMPLGEWQLVVGKWLALMGLLALLGLPLLVQWSVLAVTATPAPSVGEAVAILTGLLLVGGLFASIGVAASAATENQVVAWVVAVFLTGMLTFGLFVLADAEPVPPALGEAARFANVNLRFQAAARGVLDARDAIFFLSTTATSLFVAVRVLESQRWR